MTDAVGPGSFADRLAESARHLDRQVDRLSRSAGPTPGVERMVTAASRLVIVVEARAGEGADGDVGGAVRTLAHDLKTPLTAVLGFNALLEMSGEIDPAAVLAVAEAGHHVLLVVDAELLRSGWSSGPPASVALSPLVEQARRESAPPGLDPPRLAPSPAVTLTADPTRLREIIRLGLGLFVGGGRSSALVEVGCRTERGAAHVSLTGPPPQQERARQLARAVADACGASIGLSPTADSGTAKAMTFDLFVPDQPALER